MIGNLSVPGLEEAKHKTTPIRGHSSCRGEPDQQDTLSADCKEGIINKDNIEILNKKLRKISEEKREDLVSVVSGVNIEISQKDDHKDDRDQ